MAEIMEGESQRGRGEARRVGNTSCSSSDSNASSWSSSNARSRSRSRSVDRDRRSGRSVDNDRRSGRIISSNHLSDDRNVRPLTASSSNPANVTQRNYIIGNVAAATDNARREAVAVVTRERGVHSRKRREEFDLEGLLLAIIEEFDWELLLLEIIGHSERGEPAVPMTIIHPEKRELVVPIGLADRAAMQQLACVIISEQHINNENNSIFSICLAQYKVGGRRRMLCHVVICTTRPAYLDG